ncbi:UDP-glucose--hexose-1-phosphate uridylyltransferase [Caldisalinibacter kiritimatiensis]|uniref:Galactose-1-phosphate uridylyltransferase n=1 Tax=Caldisalinibacter kiritimatiensis TaxID=1304284 RepID=R1CQF4_9FIRM|nr:UDP-glucose--hexose-1-phosphate uridylyltransferase [Caldisalinibacter kiritimatiensis]EOD00901.1 Galactose-1-phosphate uridylyltransferase [Caldisalinibacter kiritimatiensis]
MTINIFNEIDRLIHYGLNKELIKEEDIVYCRNLILNLLNLSEYEEVGIIEENLDSPLPILNNILTWAYENGVLESNTPVYRDLLDTKIMNCLMPRPSEIVDKFYKLYDENPQNATDYFYKLSRNSNYIRTDRVAKNMVWKVNTEYGDLDITINLSKPEKDPKAIAAAKNMPASSYPKCLLCKENEGYAGRVNHPARQNHRIIPLTLKNEKWYLQYSPYVYFNEHSIVLKDTHEPMKISKDTFDRLLEFVEKFPHYFIGSNADLPIVGGSILSHDHFQGGNYEFAMATAPLEHTTTIDKFEDIEVGIVKWPMSVIRLRGNDRHKLSELADFILGRWKKYEDLELDILSHTDNIPHNTVTPIARRRDELFELDLVLRNNRTSKEHPYGIFHPHEELHHIKKENIGLIEVMGLAVLPARLKTELEQLSYYLLNPTKEKKLIENENLMKHIDWYHEIKDKYDDITEGNVDEILRKEVGLKFLQVLEHAGVFKRDDKGKKGFIKFIDSLKEVH